MSHISVREPADGRNRPGRSVDDLTVSKLLRPLVRPGTVSRCSLIERLANGDGHRIVSVVAPPGQGRQRCYRSGPSAAARLSRGYQSRNRTTTRRSCSRTWRRRSMRWSQSAGGFSTRWPPRQLHAGRSRPRLGPAFASMTSPVVVVLDDVHVLHNRECRLHCPRGRLSRERSAGFLTQPGGLPLPGADAARR